MKRHAKLTEYTHPAGGWGATWEERGDLQTTIEGLSAGFRSGADGEIFCGSCGVKAVVGKTLSRSETKSGGLFSHKQIISR
jgi:hypothetical protein